MAIFNSYVKLPEGMIAKKGIGECYYFGIKSLEDK